MTIRLLLLPGDGIGPEIAAATRRVLEAADRRFDLGLAFEEAAIGFGSLAVEATTMPQAILERAREVDGVVLGPVSTADYPPKERGGINPSAALRIALDLYANIRPSRTFDGVRAAVDAMDLVIVRENTEGFYADRTMYAGSGELMPTADLALAVRKITRQGSERVARAAGRLAMDRDRRVTIVHKANVLKLSDGLFLCAARGVLAKEFPEVAVDDQHVDAMASLLVREPGRFDVVVTTNMFGDILSNQAAELAGGLGLAASLNQGDAHAVAQAAHGSAPDVAGQDVANPASLVLSAAMLLAHLGERRDERADRSRRCDRARRGGTAVRPRRAHQRPRRYARHQRLRRCAVRPARRSVDRRMTGDPMIVDHVPLTAAVTAIYHHYGLPPADARLVAEGLVLADLRGVWSHGIARVSMYAERLRRGLIDPTPAIAVERPAPALAHLDGRNGIGFVVATRAIDAAIELADEVGVGVVGVRRSGHYGMAAIYALRAIERGFASFVYTNASPAMPPWGGRVPMLGTNPYAVGIPGGRRGDIVIDMACTVTARGKLKFAAQRGEAIPAGYALDEHGRPTTDGAAAFGGTVLPFGGHKGSALALQLDILCGLMTGAAFGGEVRNPFTGLDGPQDVGHFFLAMRPDLFLGRDAWRERMDTLIERLKSTPRADGVEEVMLPGEIEARTAQQRRRDGIPLTPDVWADLGREAERAGVDPPDPVSA